MADLTPAEGTLVYCSDLERDLIYAIRKDGGIESLATDTVVRRITGQEDHLLAVLRADPDQHQHIVQVEPEGDDWFTLRHPIMERLEGVAGSGLFECPMFEALSRLQQDAWPQEIGRYRVTIGTPEGDQEYVDFEGPLP